jgi:hypothetical protein
VEKSEGTAMSITDPPMSTPAPNEKWRVSWGAEPQLAGATVDILALPNEDGMVKVQRVIVDYISVEQLTSRVLLPTIVKETHGNY